MNLKKIRALVADSSFEDQIVVRGTSGLTFLKFRGNRESHQFLNSFERSLYGPEQLNRSEAEKFWFPPTFSQIENSIKKLWTDEWVGVECVYSELDSRKWNPLNLETFLQVFLTNERAAYIRMTHGYWDGLVRILMQRMVDPRAVLLSSDDVFFRDAMILSGLYDSHKDFLNSFFGDDRDEVYLAPTFDNGTISSQNERDVLRQLLGKGIGWKYLQQQFFADLIPKNVNLFDATVSKEIVLSTEPRRILEDFLKGRHVVVVANYESLKIIREQTELNVDQWVGVPRFRQSTAHYLKFQTWAQSISETVAEKAGGKPIFLLTQVAGLTINLWQAFTKLENSCHLFDFGKALETFFVPRLIAGGWLGPNGRPVGSYSAIAEDKQRRPLRWTQDYVRINSNEDPRFG